jgi:hypothetical protein
VISVLAAKALHAAFLAAPGLVRVASRLWRGAPAAAPAQLKLGVVSSGPVPPGWQRYARYGASPAPAGSPPGTVLALHGYTLFKPEDFDALFALTTNLGLSADALFALMRHESGLDASAYNGVAAGLVQITPAAGLPGFGTADQVKAIAMQTVVEQMSGPVRARLLQAGTKLAAMTPGDLLLWNFAPAFLGSPENTVIFAKGDVRYTRNSGLDTQGKGSITVGDLLGAAERVLAEAQGQRVDRNGRLVGAPAAAPSASAPASASASLPAKAPAAKAPAAKPAVGSSSAAAKAPPMPSAAIATAAPSAAAPAPSAAAPARTRPKPGKPRPAAPAAPAPVPAAPAQDDTPDNTDDTAAAASTVATDAISQAIANVPMDDPDRESVGALAPSNGEDAGNVQQPIGILPGENDTAPGDVGAQFGLAGKRGESAPDSGSADDAEKDDTAIDTGGPDDTDLGAQLAGLAPTSAGSMLAGPAYALMSGLVAPSAGLLSGFSAAPSAGSGFSAAPSAGSQIASGVSAPSSGFAPSAGSQILSGVAAPSTGSQILSGVSGAASAGSLLAGLGGAPSAGDVLATSGPDIDPSAPVTGILLAAVQQGTYDPPGWRWVSFPDWNIEILVMTDALRCALGSTPSVRVPITWADARQACAALGCILPTARMVDAIYAAADFRPHAVGMTNTAADIQRMATAGMVLQYHQQLEAQLAEWRAKQQSSGPVTTSGWSDTGDPLFEPVGKWWVFDGPAMIRHVKDYGNDVTALYGFFDDAGKPKQPIAGVHNAWHIDYSMVFRAVSAWARNPGDTDATIYLPDLMCQRMPEIATYIRMFLPTPTQPAG